MIRLTAQVVGGEDLDRKLASLSDDRAARTLERAVVAGALLTLNAAKVNAPVWTGNLRRSLHVGGHTDLSPDFAGGEGYSDVGGNVATRTRAEVLVGTNLVYAAQVEFGGTIKAKHAPYLVFQTSDGKWHKVKQVTQPARPYLRPAFDETKQAVVEEIGLALRDLLRAAR